MRLHASLVGSGIIIVVLSGFVRLYSTASTSSAPGKLVAQTTSIEWRSAEPGALEVTRPTKPHFVVVNVGDSPVRIREVKTSCGCATVRAEPRWVPPKGRAIIDVEATPIEVGVRPVSILLETDSPSSPEVRLQFTVIGYRRPPYLMSAVGELFYRTGYSANEIRDVFVEIVEPVASPRKHPQLSSSLPFLRFGQPTVVERGFFNNPGLIASTYQYPVVFSSPPPANAFEGEVTVADPWNPDRVQRILVHGDANQPINSSPSRVLLVLDGPEDSRAHVRLLARARDQSPLWAEMEHGDASPLSVELLEGVKEDGTTVFDVRRKPGPPVADGVYNVIIRSKGPQSQTLAVPVMVRRR
jgi:hypothetical protein